MLGECAQENTTPPPDCEIMGEGNGLFELRFDIFQSAQ